MNEKVVSNAIGGIDTILSKAKRALRELIYNRFGGSDDLGSYENPEDAMVYHFDQIYDVLLVVLEAADMPAARADLVAKWAEFEDQKGGLRYTQQFADFDHLTSPVIEYLDNMLSALRMTVSNQVTSEEAWTLSRLEAMLKATNALLRRRNIAPSKEQEIQDVMHDYMRAAFPGDFTKRPQVNGVIKNFKPDCGILSIGAAIEFKIVQTEEAAVVAFSGVVEDTAGYKGSKDWTKFFAVIYQAEPFISEGEIQSDMQRIKAGTWKSILVNGKTTPKKRTANTATRKAAGEKHDRKVD